VEQAEEGLGLIDALKTLAVGEGLTPFWPLEADDLGDLEGECVEEGYHNPSYRVTNGISRPPEWVQDLHATLRQIHSRRKVGRVVCHVAECDGCKARATRYGVVVRIAVGRGLTLEREYGEPE